MRRVFPYLLAPALLACVLGGPLNACSNQGEGERCDHLADNGGNDDCQDGLVCTSGTSLNPPQSTDRCCPQDRTQATTTVCQEPTTSVGGDAAPPPFDAGAVDSGGSDSGPVDSSALDAPATDSSSTDAPADSPGDSPIDAPADVEAEGGG